MATQKRKQPGHANRIPPLGLAFLLTVLFAAFTLLPGIRTSIQSSPRLGWSFLGAAATLLLSIFVVSRISRGRTLYYEFLPRPVHYVQFLMHSSIYAYWGYYWREVYNHVPLIAAQIVFAYVVDMLVCWSRRDKWILGFGPFPIVLSTNLFLWFRDDWFFLQFLMIATGVLCKEFVTWRREGEQRHIFNPSAIALFLFSLGLILTQSTQISWGEEIAVSFGRPPHIYLEIFLLGLVVQGLFSVTLVTLSAAAALYLMNIWYTGATGLYYFVDSNIPAAVFLGLHLLVTDPATSPRRNFGKVVFGAMYGAGVFGLYWLLGRFGAPTFYDKLLIVPPLNLTVQALDRLSVALAPAWRRWKFRPIEWARGWSPRQANFAYMAVWVCLFTVMLTTGFVDRPHPGANPEFWREACLERRGTSCETWSRITTSACQRGSGNACIALGLELAEGKMVPRDLGGSAKAFARACDAGLPNGCDALGVLVRQVGSGALRPGCARGDGESCFILASLYYAGRGVPKDFIQAAALFQQSCAHGWYRGCSGLAECYSAGRGMALDRDKALEYFEKSCRGGIVPGCFSVADIYRHRQDELTARQWLRQGCEISQRSAQARSAYFKPGSSEEDSLPTVCAQLE